MLGAGRERPISGRFFNYLSVLCLARRGDNLIKCSCCSRRRESEGFRVTRRFTVQTRSLQSSVFVLIAGSVLLLSSPVRADFYAADPVEGNSWTFDVFAYNFLGSQEFTLVAVTALNGAQFTANPLSHFTGVDTSTSPVSAGASAGSWSQLGMFSNGIDSMFVAGGDATSNLAFGATFEELAGSYQVTLFHADGTTTSAIFLAGMDAGDASLVGYTGPSQNQILASFHAPAPSASLLAILGLGFVGLVSRRFN